MLAFSSWENHPKKINFFSKWSNNTLKYGIMAINRITINRNENCCYFLMFFFCCCCWSRIWYWSFLFFDLKLNWKQDHWTFVVVVVVLQQANNKQYFWEFLFISMLTMINMMMIKVVFNSFQQQYSFLLINYNFNLKDFRRK